MSESLERAKKLAKFSNEIVRLQKENSELRELVKLMDKVVVNAAEFYNGFPYAIQIKQNPLYKKFLTKE